MGALSRSIIALLSLASLLVGLLVPHHHEAGVVCEICLYAPAGRRNPDAPNLGLAEILAANRGDARITVIRDRREAKLCRVNRPTEPEPEPGFQVRKEGGNRIHAPPSLPVISTAGGIFGRAPPLG